MASRPASIRSGGFIAAVYTAMNLLIADRNSAGPSSVNVTVCLIIASLLPGTAAYRPHRARLSGNSSQIDRNY